MKRRSWIKWTAITLGLVLLGIGAYAAIAYWQMTRVPDWYAQARTVTAQQADENHVIPARNWLAGASSGKVDAKPPEDKRQSIELSADQVNALIAKWTGNLQTVLQDVRVRVTADNITIAGYVKQQEKVVSVVIRPSVTEAAGLQVTLESIQIGNQTVPALAIQGEVSQRIIAMMSRAKPNEVRIDEHSRATREASNVYGAVSMLDLLQGRPIDPYAFVELPFEKAIVAARVREMKLSDGRAKLTLELLNPEEREAMVTRLRAAVAPPAAPPSAAVEP